MTLDKLLITASTPVRSVVCVFFVCYKDCIKTLPSQFVPLLDIFLLCIMIKFDVIFKDRRKCNNDSFNILLEGTAAPCQSGWGSETGSEPCMSML